MNKGKDKPKGHSVNIDLETLSRIKAIALKHLALTGKHITYQTIIADAMDALESSKSKEGRDEP